MRRFRRRAAVAPVAEIMFDWFSNKSKAKRGHVTITHDMIALPSGVRVVRLRCSGYYPPGCSGRPQTETIYETGARAFIATGADAVLLDIADLDYVWGDDLLRALDIPDHETIRRDDCPTAVIIGSKCQEAVQSLVADGCDNWQDANLLFFNEASALEQLSRHAHKRV